ncbi:hypothetical protein C8R44DRAFT_741029 [Mycena epipterygia]|nr:hypothetical protein C8R44DRAFT_741029 [Mycena epipterygia]
MCTYKTNTQPADRCTVKFSTTIAVDSTRIVRGGARTGEPGANSSTEGSTLSGLKPSGAPTQDSEAKEETEEREVESAGLAGLAREIEPKFTSPGPTLPSTSTAEVEIGIQTLYWTWRISTNIAGKKSPQKYNHYLRPLAQSCAKKVKPVDSPTGNRTVHILTRWATSTRNGRRRSQICVAQFGGKGRCCFRWEHRVATRWCKDKRRRSHPIGRLLGACSRAIALLPQQETPTLASACARIQLDSAEGKHYHLTYMFERLLRHAAWDMRDHCGGRDGAEKTRGRRASKDWGYCDTTRSIKVGWSASVQWMQFNVKCSNKEQDLEVHTELVSGLLHSGVGWGQSGDFETLALIGS